MVRLGRQHVPWMARSNKFMTFLQGFRDNAVEPPQFQRALGTPRILHLHYSSLGSLV